MSGRAPAGVMPAAGGQARAPDVPADDAWSKIKNTLPTLAALFFGQMILTRLFKADKGVVPSAPDATVTHPGQTIEYSVVPQNVVPLWPSNSSLDFNIFVSPSLSMLPHRTMPSHSLVVSERNFPLGDWNVQKEIQTTLTVPEQVRAGGNLYAHMFVALHGSELDPSEPAYDVKNAYYFSRPLNQILPKKKIVKTKKLLGAQDEDEIVEQEPSEQPKFASYYHPNFTISFIPDSGTLAYASQHYAVKEHVIQEPSGARDATGKNGWYYPIFFMNTFWQLREHMTELNSTVRTVPLRITIDHMPNWKFALYASIDANSKANAANVAQGGQVGLAGDGSEFEEFKRILVDTNIYLLGTTMVVSILHMIFEALAFKSDISHWRSKKDNVGISFRTIIANIVMQLIIFLYLFDNNESTSWMILFGQGTGILIEAWKITKVVDVKVRPAPPGSWLPYTITFEDKHKLSETEEKTKEYDEIAFRYLYLVAIPLLGAYAVYSLIYETHKSWYSFVITTLVGSVYAYGFLMMVPSLYINYRLKSVAHMPARAMTYKFLNTFIDDLFAFTIKMPTLHRLATLRDDVIFFIYLYQSYKYKVDYTRVNEFGQGGEDEGVDEKLASKPLVSPPSGKETPRITEIPDSEDEGGSTVLHSSETAKASGTEPKSARKRK